MADASTLTEPSSWSVVAEDEPPPRLAPRRPHLAQSPSGHPYSGKALDRWKTVHRTFFILVDFILIGLTQFEAALGRGDAPEVRAALLRIETLLLGSAVAMRLAADFPPEDYGPEVRDDMIAFDPAFTGSFSADHARMISRMSLLRRVPSYAVAEHRRLLSALDAIYRSHGAVCESFVGSAPSLAQGAGEKETSAAAQLTGPLRDRALQRAGCPFAAAVRGKAAGA